jgi:hypothetical protein
LCNIRSPLRFGFQSARDAGRAGSAVWLAPHIGQLRLQALSAGHLNGLYQELEQAGLSVSTRRLVHAVIRRALGDAVRWSRLARNPAAMADPPAAQRTRVQAWTASEIPRCRGLVYG